MVLSVLLSSVRSLENKLDELRLLRRSCRELFIHLYRVLATYSNNIPDEAVQLDGTTLFRADRDAVSSGKKRGGGLCIYINKDWCMDATLISKHCSPLAEFLFVKCRPFYTPREFTSVIVAAVYIAPSPTAKANANANANTLEALRPLHQSKNQSTNQPFIKFYL